MDAYCGNSASANESPILEGNSSAKKAIRASNYSKKSTKRSAAELSSDLEKCYAIMSQQFQCLTRLRTENAHLAEKVQFLELELNAYSTENDMQKADQVLRLIIKRLKTAEATQTPPDELRRMQEENHELKKQIEQLRTTVDAAELRCQNQSLVLLLEIAQQEAREKEDAMFRMAGSRSSELEQTLAELTIVRSELKKVLKEKEGLEEEFAEACNELQELKAVVAETSPHEVAVLAGLTIARLRSRSLLTEPMYEYSDGFE
jgi:predicted nuclease with TOPRIM domain